MWQSFEEEVIPSLSTARTNWLEVQSKFISRRHEESNICVVGGMKVKPTQLLGLSEVVFVLFFGLSFN